jgi:hypothetical protein
LIFYHIPCFQKGNITVNEYFFYLLIDDSILCANWKGLDEEIPHWFRTHQNPLSTWFWERVVDRLKICDKQELELKVKNEENNTYREKILGNVTSND